MKTGTKTKPFERQHTFLNELWQLVTLINLHSEEIFWFLGSNSQCMLANADLGDQSKNTAR